MQTNQSHIALPMRVLLTRRDFCRAAIAGVALPATRFDIATIERDRVVRAANRYLRERPVTIVAHHSERSAGGPHDYFSEGDYWWPDPEHPGGPYVQRDGMTN